MEREAADIHSIIFNTIQIWYSVVIAEKGFLYNYGYNYFAVIKKQALYNTQSFLSVHTLLQNYYFGGSRVLPLYL